MVDLATLTGAIMVALALSMPVCFSNNGRIGGTADQGRARDGRTGLAHALGPE